MDTSDQYTFEPHHFVHVRFMSYPLCTKCGLVFLKNALTAWSVKKGCDARLHPDFKAQVRKHTALR